MPINSFLYPAPSTPSFVYNVANSVRTNKADQPKGVVTQGTPTNVDKYTFSVWVKRADLGASNSKIFSVSSGSTYGEEKLEFNQDDLIWRHTQASDGSTVWERVTDRKFRDPSAWYHIVVAYDSSQGTAANRCKMYINGVEETSFSGSSNPSSGLDSYTNTSGRAFKFFTYHEDSNTSQDASAYFAEMVYIDGQQLDQTSFGEFDSDSPNIWKPIDVSGLTFGNNGFYLDFEDSSDLGADVSGNNNDLTFSNIASTDQSTDTCTNNFATLNPLYKQDHAFSDGNLTHTSSSADWDSGVSTIAASSGKYYFEAKVTAIEPPTRTMLGVGDVRDANEIAEDQFGLTNYSNGDTVAYYGSDGSVYKNGSQQSGSWSSFTTNDIVGMYVDLDNGKVYFSKNGDMQNSGDPTSGSTGTGAISITTGQTYVFGVTHYGGGAGQINFGSPPFSISSGNSDPNGYGNFEYDPQGYYALNTKNLAEFG